MPDGESPAIFVQSNTGSGAHSRPLDLLEALLFVQAEPVTLVQLATWLQMDVSAVEWHIGALAQRLAERGSGLTVQRVAEGVRLTTHPRLADLLHERLSYVAPEPLSHASWEVLAIVAYRQPITRMEIEAVRQTGSERALETLMQRQLIEEVGRKEAPGRPILYGTTAHFLTQFGLSSVGDLPKLELDGPPDA
ncbi:MAG: SMC-Scp complex subunit ScpB [Sulfobacillus acidophilus]|uniref:SMC-Scp complex subunit ScpB n=1 Tax=Sulfobacillus acidophilus TaxID=53633 RepID=A0A2T2WKT5_9FIRM|nr:MAG: SMC-Scp complex subunit ScpB [Sulfobacillus acidophilus]